MAYPVGVVTTQLTFGTAQAMIGQDALAMTVKVTPTTNLVYAGNVFIADTKVIQVAAGGSGAVTLINPDQAGFFNGGGLAIRNWGYTFEITYSNGSAALYTAPPKIITWFASDAGPLDVDTMVPIADGSGILVPATTVSSAIATLSTLTTDTTVSPLLDTVTVTRAKLDSRYGSGKALSGAGIDPTGTTVSTAAVQAFLDGCVDGTTVVVPNGAIINLGGPLVISHRIKLTGSGELRWTAWDSANHALNIHADSVTLDGIYMTNPNHLGTQAAAGFFGVNVSANQFRCVNSRILDFQSGIVITENGEWHDHIITGNFVRVIGGGSGRGVNDSLGEDRGDGIVCWGASAIITGNRVHCLEGFDARIGIHCEALSDREVTAYVHHDALVTITGNLITGQFRRGIVSEQVAHVDITGNVIADCTWWGVAIIGPASYCTVANNSIRYTRTAADTQGEGNSPIHAGIMVYINGFAMHGCLIVNNNIHATVTAAIDHGIMVYGDTVTPIIGMQINGNMINDESGTMRGGVTVGQHVTDVQINDNHVNTFQDQGIYVWGGTGLTAHGNRLYGPNSPSATCRGFFLDGVAARHVTNNVIRSVNTGIHAANGSVFTVMSENVFQTMSLGIELAGTSGPAAINGNIFTGVAGAFSNLPAGNVSTGNAS